MKDVVLTIDLRSVNTTAFVDCWSSALSTSLKPRLNAWFHRLSSDPNNPLLPDLLGTYKLITKSIAEQKAHRIVFQLPSVMGQEMSRLLTAIVLETGLNHSITLKGPISLEIDPTTNFSPLDLCIPVLPRESICRTWKSLAAEGRSSEALLAINNISTNADKILTASILLNLHATAEARTLARTVRSDDPQLASKAKRIEIIAARSMSDMTALPELLKAIPQPLHGDPLSMGWMKFDKAVASSFDSVRMGYIRFLKEARAISLHRSEILTTACDLWSAGYYVHKGQLNEATQALRSAVNGLEQQCAMLRSLPVALRLAHLEWSIHCEEAAIKRLNRVHKLAIICSELRLADEATFALHMFSMRRSLNPPHFGFYSDQAKVFINAMSRLDKRAHPLPENAGMLETRLFVEVAKTAIESKHSKFDTAEWQAQLLRAISKLSPEDKLNTDLWMK